MKLRVLGNCYEFAPQLIMLISIIILPVPEAKVGTDVLYFDMVEAFRDKLLCVGKGHMADLMKT